MHVPLHANVSAWGTENTLLVVYEAFKVCHSQHITLCSRVQAASQFIGPPIGNSHGCSAAVPPPHICMHLLTSALKATPPTNADATVSCFMLHTHPLLANTLPDRLSLIAA